MSKKLTQEEFLERAKEVHCDTYRYDKTVVKGSKIPVTITCPIHGDFEQRPGDHLRGCGCPLCGIEKSRKAKRNTTEEFIEKAKKVHGNKYDYSKVEYIDKLTPVIIICPIHGEFTQTPDTHLNGSGCQKCGVEKSKQTATSQKLTTEKFIEKSRKIHGDKYDYSKVEYINSHTPVKIICKIHGEFEQSPTNHLCGKGCPICGGKNMTTEQFIEKARIIHGDRHEYEEFKERVYKLYGNKYDISKVDLKNCNENGKICLIYHDESTGEDIEFYRTLKSFLKGKCIFPEKSSKKINIDELIEKCTGLYGDLYDLSRITKYGYDKKYNIYIKCPKHGWVKVNIYTFLKGYGCPLCKKERHHYKYTTESYKEACRKVHGDKYDLSKVSFDGIKNKITVICPTHGEFNISADSFIQGAGCKYCGYDKLSSLNRKTLEQYIKDAKNVHGDRYIIDKSIGYTTAKSSVYPICRIHGRFEINASSFLSGCGCSKCFGNNPLTTEEFVERANIAHNGKYNYNNTIYIDAKHPVKIECPNHGEFEQLPFDHLSGKGCKKCAKQISKAEISISNYISSLINPDELIQNDRSVLSDNKELDIYLPNFNLAIEYDGLVWHSEKFARDKLGLLHKTIEAQNKNIHLIHIFEDEWLYHQDLVKDKLCHMLHKDNGKIKIGGRKCELKEIDCSTARIFLEKYHIQGWASSSVYYGAFYQSNLVGVMSFLKESDGMWNLTRFSTNIDYAIPGLANKMFNFFIKNYGKEVIEVKTFLDRRWSWNKTNVYDKMEFKLEKTTPPSYYYIKGLKRYHKFGFRKNILHKKYGLPLNMTELEMTSKLGYYRIWDCGLYKYVWRNSQQN